MSTLTRTTAAPGAPQTQTHTLPRELVLASAGTGKTFRISSRIIGLLAAGAAPDQIFASTFTRKAAGEILDRVLTRLAAAALDATAAAELATHAGLPAASTEATPGGWLRLLGRLVSALHRLNISTLDSFFVRTAGSFADELTLPPGWRIADAPTMERVRADALHRVLAEADAGELIELLRALQASDAARSVHDSLLRQAEELLALHHALDPEAAEEAWDGFGALAGAAPADLDARRLRLAEEIARVQPPLTKKGVPDGRWTAPLAAIAEGVREGRWEALFDSTLCRNALSGEGRFYGTEIPDELCALLEEGCVLARHAVARRLSLQGRSMGRLARHLAEAMEQRQREMGAFEFGDLTRLLGGPDALCERMDLYYRLDAQVRHVLLDEFQDTSLAQWEALSPVLDELASGHEGERAAVVVADPKQSIYAWRGGEPQLVRYVGETYLLDHQELSRSWRSSQLVLDLVNRVFERLDENALFEGDEVAQRAAAEWCEAFTPHDAAKDLAGYVRLLVGPKDEGSGGDRPRLCRRAAELVAELRAEAPGRTIGVLTRTNRTVARIMLELRNVGIHASEEGGNPLTDSAAVSALLSLLRLADHPGDRIARYHVAKTPLGAAIGLTDHEDAGAARHVARRIRGRLLEHGYGTTLGEIVRDFAGACEPRDRRRLAQLVELGFRYDARATLRTTDFVRVVESERVEDPTTADVRVMTVHQSKGLEFDIVVLPELDSPLKRADPKPLTYRPTPTGRITRVFPYVGEATRALFPEHDELHLAAEQAEAARWRDALSGLYVALTRARHALHILVKPDGKSGPGSAKSGARLVRLALAPDLPAEEGAVLYESGDPRWYRAVDEETEMPIAAPAPAAAAGVPPSIRLARSRKEKALPQLRPSALAGGSGVKLGAFFRLERRAAEQGTLAHAWFERIGWLEEGIPSDEELRAIARRVMPTLPEAAVAALRDRFRGWLEMPAIRRALSRETYGSDAIVECERAFLHRRDGRLMEGVIDRLVLLHDGGRVVGAEILDYKTDALAPGDAAELEARVAHYRPQLDAYRAAVAAAYALPGERVTTRLILLEAASVVEV